MKFILAQAIYWFAELLTFVMLVRVLFSWIRPNPYGTLGRVNEFCIRLTEPIVAPCRQLLSRFNTGMFDFSVLLAFFLVQFAANLMIRIIL
ncbi:MAG: YggT family protein [Firmicutes bacterium]|jgi:YggT family protein|nr:YggT family protein [Bacillota bacterium]